MNTGLFFFDSRCIYQLKQSDEDWCLSAIYRKHVTTPATSTHARNTDSDVVDDVTQRYNMSAAVFDDNDGISSTGNKRGLLRFCLLALPWFSARI